MTTNYSDPVTHGEFQEAMNNVTVNFANVKAEVVVARAESKADIATVRAEFKEAIAEVKASNKLSHAMSVLILAAIVGNLLIPLING